MLDLHMFSEKVNRYMNQFQITVNELSQQTGIEEFRINKLLECALTPTGDEILILADFFKCDYNFFISNEKLAPFEQTELLFRKHGSELTKEDRWAIQEFLYLCECQEYILSNMEGFTRKPFVFKKRGEYYKAHGEEAAIALRKHLGYSDNSIPLNIFESFRKIGIHVFRRKLGQSNISGLFIKHPIAGQCVLVNYDEDVYRQIFTAVHETGHAILDEDKDFVVSFNYHEKELSEIRANTFASRFLLPKELLRLLPNPAQWKEEDLLRFSTQLKVNTNTLLFALKDAKLIENDVENKLKHIKVPKHLKTDPELPETLTKRSRERKEELLQKGLSDYYVDICFEAYNKDFISASRLAEMLLVSETELHGIASLYGRTISHVD